MRIAKLRAEENLGQTKLAAMAGRWRNGAGKIKTRTFPDRGGPGAAKAAAPSSSSVDFSTVADAQNKYEQPIV